MYLKYEPINTNEIQLASLLWLTHSYLTSTRKKFDDFMVSSSPYKKSSEPISGEALDKLLQGMF